MKITREEVNHVATLARLHLDDAANTKMVQQIGRILEYVETLNRVETLDIEPTFHAIALNNAFRDDREREHLGREKTLGNAPQSEDGNFIVPKVI